MGTLLQRIVEPYSHGLQFFDNLLKKKSLFYILHLSSLTSFLNPYWMGHYNLTGFLVVCSTTFTITRRGCIMKKRDSWLFMLEKKIVHYIEA